MKKVLLIIAVLVFFFSMSAFAEVKGTCSYDSITGKLTWEITEYDVDIKIYVGNTMIGGTAIGRSGHLVDDCGLEPGTYTVYAEDFSGKYPIGQVTIPAPVSIVASGSCGAEGDNVTWTLDSNGLLTISGSGAMVNHTDVSNVPWFNLKSNINEIVINDGVTHIGSVLFGDISNLSRVTLPDSVTSIGDVAFALCGNLTEITIPETVSSIGMGSFANCYGLESITILDAVVSIGNEAFSNCTALTDVYILGTDMPIMGTDVFYNCMPTVHCVMGTAIDTWAKTQPYEIKYISNLITPEPTPEATIEPTPEPTVEPTPEPTVEPTPEATVETCSHPESEYYTEMDRDYTDWGTYFDEWVHVRTYDEYEFIHCGICHTRLSGELTNKAVKEYMGHNYDESGTCYDCGFENENFDQPCPHPEEHISYSEELSYYGYDSEYHNRRSTKSAYCHVCNRKLSYMDIHSLELEAHSIVDGKCDKCRYDASCEHPNFTISRGVNTVTSTSEYDETLHVRTGAYIEVLYCSKCWSYCTTEVLDENYTWFEEHHYINAGESCWECGYTPDCKHPVDSRNVVIDKWANEILSSDASEHTINAYCNEEEYCLDCGMLLRRDELGDKTITEAHSFNASGTCDVCQYTVDCKHTGSTTTRVETASLTITERKATTHTGWGTAFEYTYCDDCGYQLSRKLADSSEVYTEAHKYKNDVCIVCGYYLNSEPTPEPTAAPTPAPTDTDDIVVSGTCGTNLTWTLDADGVLTISGSGKMTDYSYSTDDAWNGNYEKIESVVISEGVTTVGDYAFNGCKALTSVSLPESLTSIGAYAFQSCTALTSISIPDGVTEIKSGTFYMCDVLSNVKLPSNLTTIGGSSFIFTSIEEIDIPDTLTTIRDTAFYGSKLKSFTIPDSVTTIGIRIFQSCKSLTDVYFLGSDLPTINDEAFFGCNPIIHCEKGSAIDTWAAGKEIRRVYDLVEPTASLVIPAYTRTIGDESFMGTNIQKVVLSDKCTTIGSRAFADCADLVVIYMPDSVTSIATSAFDGCYGFKFVCESNNAAAAFAETNGIYWEIE